MPELSECLRFITRQGQRILQVRRDHGHDEWVDVPLIDEDEPEENPE